MMRSNGCLFSVPVSILLVVALYLAFALATSTEVGGAIAVGIVLGIALLSAFVIGPEVLLFLAIIVLVLFAASVISFAALVTLLLVIAGGYGAFVLQPFHSDLLDWAKSRHNLRNNSILTNLVVLLQTGLVGAVIVAVPTMTLYLFSSESAFWVLGTALTGVVGFVVGCMYGYISVITPSLQQTRGIE